MRTPGRHSVGDGLMLVVNPGGSRSWLARVRDPNGKRRDLGLGSYPEVTLKEARDRAAGLRRQVRDNIDPVAAKRKAREVVPTFEQSAIAAHDERKAGYRNLKHREDWIRSLREYAFPTLGHLAIDQITGPMIVQTMKKIWTAKPETARRVLQRIALVLARAAANGHREHEAPMKAIRMGLPPQPKRVDIDGKHHRTAKHHAALPYAQAATFLAQLRAQEPTGARQALELIILTATRSGEARGARWAEFDLEAGLWTIPGDRMKMGEDHVVPLSPPALTLLRAMNEVRHDDMLFPGFANARARGKDRKPISDTIVRKVMIELAPGYTVHGWRSTFRDWVSEETNAPSEVAEKCLAHQIPNAVERAYRRGDLLEKRRQLMGAWSVYLDGRTDNVVNFRGAA